MSYDPCSRNTEPTSQVHEATEPRLVKVVQHHAYRRPPEREFFVIESARNHATDYGHTVTA